MHRQKRMRTSPIHARRRLPMLAICKKHISQQRRTILYLEERCANCVVEGCTKEHTTTPVWGHFLQEECQKIDWDAQPPLYCNIGRQKTTASKKKCRLVHLPIRVLKTIYEIILIKAMCYRKCSFKVFLEHKFVSPAVFS